jgi:hypothetical protein
VIYAYAEKALGYLMQSDLGTSSQLAYVGFPPGRVGTGFPGRDPVPSGNRDGTE